jgi:AcrR family transcriptional regulator
MKASRKIRNVAQGTRSPVTPRAQLTVEAILQAFAKLQQQYRYEEITTNLIAERAGVSVGALYQYFANKEAIAVALLEETSARAAVAVREAIVQHINESIRVTLPRALAALLRCYREHRSILIDLPDSNPRIREAVRHLSIEDLINRSSKLYIEEHTDEIRERDLEVFRYVLYAVVKGAIREYLTNPPENLDDERFVDQLAKITSAYATAD